MPPKVFSLTFGDMSLSTAGNIYKNRILIQPHPLCISRTRKRLFWVRAYADDTSRAPKGLFWAQTYADDVSRARRRPFRERPIVQDTFRAPKA